MRASVDTSYPENVKEVLNGGAGGTAVEVWKESVWKESVLWSVLPCILARSCLVAICWIVCTKHLLIYVLLCRVISCQPGTETAGSGKECRKVNLRSWLSAD